MDRMDRMLHSLPRHIPSPELAAHIQASIHRRHRSRQILRWMAACVLTISGMWLISPAAVWFSSTDLYSSGTPWFLSIMNYLGLESVQMFDHLWNGMLALQNQAGTSLVLSIWIGALFLCLGLLFAFDGQEFPMPTPPFAKYQK